MSKPVDKIEFWKNRIDFAKGSGRMHHSVFIAGDAIWKRINDAHRKILAAEIKAGDNVLDAGCGYGRASEMMPEGTAYFGVDFSFDFINEARKLYPDRHFNVCDLRKLPFKDKQFDVGFCISVKHMIVSNMGAQEWDLMENELRRVCKKVVILEYGTSDAGISLEADKYEVIA